MNAELIELIDAALQGWSSGRRDIVSVTEARDILLDIRLLATEQSEVDCSA